MTSSVLLTGGAGYIGGHVALALHDAGRRIVILDDLSTGARCGILPDAVFYEGEIGNRELLDVIFGECEIGAIMHLAAVASVPDSTANPERCDKINRRDAAILIESARHHHVPYFIFSSTSVVYDETATPPFAENAPLAPISPYAATKLATENFLATPHYAGTNNAALKYAILRYFNVGGADPKGRTGGRKKNDTTLIQSAVECAAKKRPHLNIYGTDYPTADGTCVRDYIHVSDIAAAHLLALQYLEGGGASDIFNLGLGRGFSVREVLAAAKTATGTDFAIKEEARREGDPVAIYANAEKARRVLGFAPKYNTLEEIISDAWAWERAKKS